MNGRGGDSSASSTGSMGFALSPVTPATPVVRRIAIVDFDIHHGNGTEEIIRNLSPRTVAMPLPPSWAPRTFESYRPWLDETDPDEVRGDEKGAGVGGGAGGGIGLY